MLSIMIVEAVITFHSHIFSEASKVIGSKFVVPWPSALEVLLERLGDKHTLLVRVMCTQN